MIFSDVRSGPEYFVTFLKTLFILKSNALVSYAYIAENIDTHIKNF